MRPSNKGRALFRIFRAADKVVRHDRDARANPMLEAETGEPDGRRMTERERANG